MGTTELLGLEAFGPAGALLRSPPRPALTIQVRAGAGRGPTTLAAFDAALRDAGVANYNLIRLSSVIPPGSAIVEPPRERLRLEGGWGDRLYVVMAEQRADVPGHEAWAGIGWVQDPVSRQGLFAEHEGTTADGVEHDLAATLTSIAAARDVRFGPIRTRVVGAYCQDEPVCAMVLAVYQASPWLGGDGGPAARSGSGA